ncbi:MAG: hypothetical protein Q8R28_13495, partial [Dehalococcoidia bacterium]|nr:hypothetical protein [Dehalococcoidia bacterium]
MADILYDDTYTGPRWTYGLQYRPVAVETLPKGWIVFSKRPHKDFRNFGTVDFPFELSERDVQAFQLTLAGKKSNPAPNPSQSHVRRSIAASIIAAAHKEGLPIYRAQTKRTPSRPGVYVRPGGSGPILVEWWGEGKEGWTKVLAIVKKLGYYAERPAGEDGPIWVAPAGFKGWGRGPSANPVAVKHDPHEVNYRRTSSLTRSCSGCRYWHSSHAAGWVGTCDIVKGAIRGQDVCDMWEQAGSRQMTQRGNFNPSTYELSDIRWALNDEPWDRKRALSASAHLTDRGKKAVQALAKRGVLM